MSIKNKLNLVYDNWDDTTNLPYQPNSMELYPNSYHMPSDAVINGLNIDNNLIDRFKLLEVSNFPNKIFYYFITLMPNVIGENIIENKLPMLSEVVECLKNNKNFNVIIMNWQEWESFETFKLIHNWSLLVGLNQSQLWISNNNPKLNEYKTKLNSNINVYSTKYLPNIGPISIRNAVGVIDFKENKEGNLFMCHNRRIKPHRYGILCLLKKYGILDNVDWSLVCGWNIKDENISAFYSNVFNIDDVNNMANEIEYFNNVYQKKSKYEEEYDWFDRKDDVVEWNKPYEKTTFENSYFNITTESEYLGEVIHLSEKSFKPFYGMQFPLILASYNHIKEIKKRYDFDFFDDVIDHSYDNIQNNRDRIFAFANEIKRINDNKNFFIEFYKNNKQRFIMNNLKSMEYAKSSLNLDVLFLLNLANEKKLI
jgi:hypothetical protein